jgi:hypothetical protein
MLATTPHLRRYGTTERYLTYGERVTGFENFTRPSWPKGTTEGETLWGFLDFYRATLAKKCAGLSEVQLTTAAIPPSTLTLLGLVRHLLEVERWWIDVVFFGDDDVPVLPVNSDDPDGDFNDVGAVPANDVAALCATNWEAWRERVSGHTFDETSVGTTGRFRDDGSPEHFTLRFIAAHLVEEYARHCGHADLLREVLDGAAGH